LRQDAVAFSLRLEAVIVHLEKEIFRSKNIAESCGAGARLVELIGLDCHVDLALETGAHPNQTRGVRSEQFLVDPRLVMHALEMRDRHQLDQIAVTRLVASQESKMISSIALRIRAISN